LVSALKQKLSFLAGARSIAAGLFLFCLVPCYAQSPPAAAVTTAPPAPLLGFMSSDEINRIVRAAGFIPLAPARREGTMYEVRASDYRDVLMRIVIDGRSGVIRAVNRIVAVVPDGVVGLLPPPHGGLERSKAPTDATPPEPSPSETAAHDSPAARDLPSDHAIMSAAGGGSAIGAQDSGVLPRPLTKLRGTDAALQNIQPLPRPRPLDLTSQKAKASGKQSKTPAATTKAAPAQALVPQN
jgi:hypothetical protein